MKPIYKVLISSIDAFGHINCVLGFGELLSQFGHEVTFANRQQYRKLADKRGFKFIPFDESIFNSEAGCFVPWVDKNLEKFRQDEISRFQGWTESDKQAFGSITDEYRLTNAALEKVLSENSFDIIIGDFVIRFPCLYNSSIPYIPLCSLNPLILYPQGPPTFSGYSVHVDPEAAKKFKDVYDEATSGFKGGMCKWWAEENIPYPGEPWMLERPRYFGFYHFPEALDYSECGPRIENWIRVDSSIRQPDSGDFILPRQLVDLPGKLIYFSLGSLGSTDVKLMNRLINILSKSPNRFIVSKGPKGDEIELPRNMWGQNYVNQISILQIVDMVITHGGNNTIMESIYYGKPMIVIPFFFDQMDNAQRVVDKSIGRRIDFWSLDEDDFLDSIEAVLADGEIKQRINNISNSMKNSTSREEAVKMIENLIQSTKINQVA